MHSRKFIQRTESRWMEWTSINATNVPPILVRIGRKYGYRSPSSLESTGMLGRETPTYYATPFGIPFQPMPTWPVYLDCMSDDISYVWTLAVLQGVIDSSFCSHHLAWRIKWTRTGMKEADRSRSRVSPETCAICIINSALYALYSVKNKHCSDRVISEDVKRDPFHSSAWFCVWLESMARLTIDDWHILFGFFFFFFQLDSKLVK